ncbi:helix-turn-helix domain-containing protein [Fulvivirgaceae bacterium PWU5]|uniref:Helix-turn-helix domain-containing protein n=1 Tax=Dawidia cretensis TaxID=2782350 RepID=A0AAP2GS40_9BACT|nr:helix-turn-helix transcriptional regulator [Dawidia cretensis]MBT1711311.1 helix-turn-helix domain-containing protein [Dawidia cretensis]
MKEDELLTVLQTRIGLKITNLRKEKGYTSHEDFAHEHNIPRMQYWRIEKGKTNLTLRTLTKILLIHGLTVEQFFTDLPKEPRKTPRATKE